MQVLLAGWYHRKASPATLIPFGSGAFISKVRIIFFFTVCLQLVHTLQQSPGEVFVRADRSNQPLSCARLKVVPEPS